jgi:hypothetical protein
LCRRKAFSDGLGAVCKRFAKRIPYTETDGAGSKNRHGNETAKQPRFNGSTNRRGKKRTAAAKRRIVTQGGRLKKPERQAKRHIRGRLKAKPQACFQGTEIRFQTAYLSFRT